MMIGDKIAAAPIHIIAGLNSQVVNKLKYPLFGFHLFKFNNRRALLEITFSREPDHAGLIV